MSSFSGGSEVVLADFLPLLHSADYQIVDNFEG
jgi:hypothetical protein